MGLDNFVRMFSDARLHNSLGVTFTYVLVGVPLQRTHELDRVAALREDTVEGAIEGHEFAIEGRADHVVDSDRGRVAQHGHGILEGDGLAVVGALVEQQLVDLANAETERV